MTMINIIQAKGTKLKNLIDIHIRNQQQLSHKIIKDIYSNTSLSFINEI